MRRKRNGFSRLGLLSIALLLALGVMGIGYAAWTDEVTIHVTAKTGYIEVELSPGVCSDPETIGCSVVPEAPHTLVVTLTNPASGNYTCDFTITNQGTIPVRIQSIVISGVPNGAGTSLSGVEKGTQIEQAGGYPDSVGGMVLVSVPPGCEGTFSFSVAFSFVAYNLYVE